MTSLFERVVYRGGPLDGMLGEIMPEASRRGFAIYVEGEGDDERWFGYYAAEAMDGFRVFQLGKSDS
jgi:hypothetical protein